MLTVRPIKQKRREILPSPGRCASAGGSPGGSPLLYSPPQRVQVSCPLSLTLPQLSQRHGNEPVGGILSLPSCSQLEIGPLYALLLRSCVQTKDSLLRLRARTPGARICQSQNEAGRTLAQSFRTPLAVLRKIEPNDKTRACSYALYAFRQRILHTPPQDADG